jgi:hypothetical protein
MTDALEGNRRILREELGTLQRQRRPAVRQGRPRISRRHLVRLRPAPHRRDGQGAGVSSPVQGERSRREPDVDARAALARDYRSTAENSYLLSQIVLRARRRSAGRVQSPGPQRAVDTDAVTNAPVSRPWLREGDVWTSSGGRPWRAVAGGRQRRAGHWCSASRRRSTAACDSFRLLPGQTAPGARPAEARCTRAAHASHALHDGLEPDCSASDAACSAAPLRPAPSSPSASIRRSAISGRRPASKGRRLRLVAASGSGY